MQEIITGAGHSSAVDWWALGKYLLVWPFKFFEIHQKLLFKLQILILLYGIFTTWNFDSIVVGSF